MGLKHKSLEGTTLGYMTFIKRLPNKNEVIYYLTKCKCGTERETRIDTVYRGIKKNYPLSCGCLHIKEKGEGACFSVYSKYRGSAKKRNLEFDLSLTKFKELTQQNCTYCGSPPKSIQGKELQNGKNQGGYNGEYTYNGLDRVDNTKGYIESNLTTCCIICNKAKATLSIEEFFNWVEKIYNHSIIKEQIY